MGKERVDSGSGVDADAIAGTKIQMLPDDVIFNSPYVPITPPDTYVTVELRHGVKVKVGCELVYGGQGNAPVCAPYLSYEFEF